MNARAPQRLPSRLSPALQPAMSAPPPLAHQEHMPHAYSMPPPSEVRLSPMAHQSFSCPFDDCLPMGDPPVPMPMDEDFDLPFLDSTTALLCLDLLGDDREQMPLPSLPPAAFAQHMDCLGQPLQQHQQMYTQSCMPFGMDPHMAQPMCA